jgi:hypothetical protein
MHSGINSMLVIPAQSNPWPTLARNLVASILAVAIFSAAVAGFSAIGNLDPPASPSPAVASVASPAR